jgi:hypothetical protein
MKAAAWVWLAAFAAPAQVMPEADLASARQVVQAIYSLDYARAANLSRQWIAAHPDDPMGYVLLARTMWAEQLNSAQGLTIERFASSNYFSDSSRHRVPLNADAERRFREASESGIRTARAKLQKNPQDMEALYALSLAHQNLASYDYSMKGDWKSAARNAERTVEFSKRLSSAAPAFADAKLVPGITSYIIGTLPWHIRIFPYLAGYRGSRERGLQDLETVAARGQLAQDDARATLALLHARDKEYDLAAAKLSELHQKYPANYLVHLEMGGLALARRRPEDALVIYTQILEKQTSGQDGYGRLERAVVLNRLGVAARTKGDLPASEQWFRKALDDPKRSERSQAVAYLELGKTLDLMGRRDDAVASYRLAAQAVDVAGSRRDAQALIERPYRG